eukprot:TRINITY_DN73648_c0_g1_i1.p1 TRINITY_DN73648_c0_g1~~TRINITY_DN73648_c0_g1_i1.p1  ORF type:complete len:563 (+),score=99.42 TRINITY_DN73648_c0_g1_i1:50-1738(+)
MMNPSAAVDVEELQQPGSGEAQSSVGILGWLGFVVLNFAAWGFIGLSSTILWQIGLGACAIYTGVLTAFAIFAENRGKEYRQFANLFWVLACTFLAISGVFLAYNVVTPWVNGEEVAMGSDFEQAVKESNPMNIRTDLVDLLPNESSDALRSWAGENRWTSFRQPDFAVFAGTTFFTGLDVSSGSEVLMRANEYGSENVTPGLISPSSFVQFDSKLFLSAWTQESGREVWYIDAKAAPRGRAERLLEVVEGPEDGGVRHLFVDNSSSMLFFKASYRCPKIGRYVETIFRSNGTRLGTEDLNPDACVTTRGFNASVVSPLDGGAPPQSLLWSTLLISVLPMLTLASYVLASRRMAGVFLNLFVGIWAVFTLLHWIAVFPEMPADAYEFQKVFVTIYTALLWIGILFLEAFLEDPPKWVDEIKTWAVPIVGSVFFGVIHLDLEIPSTTSVWRWVIYAILLILQAWASIVVSRSFPLLLSAVGVFTLIGKTSYELVDLVGFDSSTGSGLLFLTIVGAQGLLITVAGAYYRANQEDVDGTIRQAFLSCNGWQNIVAEPLTDGEPTP